MEFPVKHKFFYLLIGTEQHQIINKHCCSCVTTISVGVKTAFYSWLHVALNPLRLEG